MLFSVFYFQNVLSVHRIFRKAASPVSMKLRLNVHLLNSLDSSYSDHSKWTFASEKGVDDLLSVTYYESVDYYRVSTPEDAYISGFDTFYINYGNGDTDTVSYMTYAFSSECCTSSWVSKMVINGDSLTRDIDDSYKFVKWPEN